MSRCFD